MFRDPRTLVVCLLVAATSAAQQSKVIPAERTSIEGFITHAYPWSYSQVRFQQVIAAPAVASSGAVINAISFRRDASTALFNAKTWSYRITLHETAVTPATMTKTFASNLGANPGVVVFDGAINFPAPMPAWPTPNPFTLRVPFTTNFVYTAANGNLLIEIEGNDPANLFDPWRSDAEIRWTTVRGDVAMAGTRCTGANNESIDGGASATGIVLGGRIDFAWRTTPAGLSPAVHWLGTSNQAFGPVPLPLPIAGAPGCSLATDLIALQASTLSPISWPIPQDQALENAVIYMQGLVVAPAANAAGLVTSEALQVRIGGPTPSSGVMQSVYLRGPAAADGAISPHAFSCVLRLEGAFN
jgi:hypothetical protein